MSNVPSDNLCDDTCLSDCVGLRLKDGEIKAVRNGKLVSTFAETNHGVSEAENAVYVHKNGEYTHLITYGGLSSSLKCYVIGDGGVVEGSARDIGQSFDGVPLISSIGNILITQYQGIIRYFKWENDKYTELGDLPHLDFDMRPSGSSEMYFYEIKEDATSEDLKKIIDILDAGDAEGLNASQMLNRNNEVVALIEGAYKVACKKKMFMFPFFMRVGILLYDGSVTRLTPPTLILPTIRGGAFVHESSADLTSKVKAPYDVPKNITANRGVSYELKITKDGDLSKYGELVRGIVVYMTNPVKTYETSYPSGSEGRDFYIDGVSQEIEILDDWLGKDGTYNSFRDNTYGITQNLKNKYVKASTSGSTATYDYWMMPPYGKSDKEIFDELIKSGTFYKLAEIDINDAVFDDYRAIESYIGSHVLENITAQEQLEHDDYFGNAKHISECIYSYNSRLNLADIKRYPYLKAKSGMQTFKDGTITAMDCYVYIQASDTVVKANCGKVDCPNDNKIPLFFFYPDPKAKAVEFVHGSNHYYKKLSVHPRLNGSYYYIGLPGPSDNEYYQGVDYYADLKLADSEPDICKLASYSDYETLPNDIMTSEVNNPFVFNAEGDNSVGTGKIIGLVANTVAISQGQFGQYPMIVFTTQGIYALYVNSNGLFSSSAPLSREVCNNPDSITPTDGAVFFTSDKGLMRMIGAQIVCISDQMMGKKFVKSDGIGIDCGTAESFANYLKDCKIGYDYKEKCLHIINAGYTYHYVVDIATSAITRCKNTGNKKYQYVVNNYPDNFIEDEDGNVYSFINKPDINEDTNSYDGILLSRPIKFGNAQLLKSLRQVLHVDDIHSGASVTLHVYVSNNLKDWGELKSLRGMGWKYFRFGLSFSGLSATDSYSGLLAITQGRRTDKLR